MINIYDFICSNSSFFDQMQFNDAGDIFIDYVCPIQEEHARAWSHKNCLMYVVQGDKGYASVDQYHRSRQHEILFIRKGGVILHQYFQKPYRALIFMFNDDAIKDFISEYPALMEARTPGTIDISSKQTIASLSSNPFIKSIFLSSLDYLKTPTAESAISLQIKFKELFVNILRDKDQNTFAQYLAWLCSDSDASFIRLMRENSCYNFTTSELAKISCMSLSTFKREFMRIFMVPPGKWLRDQRLARAIELLCTTKKSISEIAFELGYGDAASFSKAFKAITKETPTDYRENRN